MIQVYEDTSGLTAGEPVTDTREPLRVELGPGLLGSIFDGTQRPLTVLARAGENPWGTADDPARAVGAGARPRTSLGVRARRRAPVTAVGAGDTLGTVQETAQFTHRILVPPGVAGTVTDVRSGSARVDDPVVWIDGRPLTMLSRWPVRHAAAGRGQARPRHAVRQRSAVDRHALPARARRDRDDPGRLRHRQDGARAVAREVGPRRRDRLRRLRRARQRADGSARRVPAAHRSTHRRVADGADDPRREHEQHAGRGTRGEHLHRNHDRRVLPRPGLPRRVAGRQHEPLGGSAARGVEPAGGDAGRGGLPRLPGDAARRVLRARGRGRLPRPRRAVGLGLDRRRRLAGRRRLLRADHAAQPAPRRDVLGARHDARAPAALPFDQLEPQLHALRARRVVRP